MSETSPLPLLRNSGWRRSLPGAALAAPHAQRPAAAGSLLGRSTATFASSIAPTAGPWRAARRHAGCVAEGRAFILAFWHGRMMMIPMAWQRMAPMHMLISAHRDGRIIADAVSYFGIQSIAGSTRRGGSAALRNMLKQLKEGDCVGDHSGWAARPGDERRASASSMPRGSPRCRSCRSPMPRAGGRVLAQLGPFPSSHCRSGAASFCGASRSKSLPSSTRPGSSMPDCLIEARMNEMVDEADRRVGHGVSALQPPDARLSSSPRTRGSGQGETPSRRHAVQPEKPR